MSRQCFVIDTNIVVAGILSGSPDSPTVHIVDAMLSGRIVFVMSPDILLEYRHVLLRPKLRKLHKLSETEVDELLGELVFNAIWVEPSLGLKHRAPDGGDQHLWNLLASGPGAVLVTGDQLLIQSPRPGSKIISPWQCVALLQVSP